MSFTTPQAGAGPGFLRNSGTQWIQHGDNVITLSSPHPDTTYLGEVTIRLANMGGVTTRGPYHNTNPMSPTVQVGTNTRLLVRLHGGYGFTSVNGDQERVDDIANTWTNRTSTTRKFAATFSLNGFGFIAGGDDGAVSVVNQRFDDVANALTARTALTTAIEQQAGFTINGLGISSGGTTLVGGSDPGIVGTTLRFDDVANSWTARANLNTPRRLLSGYGLNNFGFTSGGHTAAGATVGTTEKLDDTANTWTARTALNTAREQLSGFSLNGYGFTSGGYIAAVTGTTERFDDVANTWTARTALNTARVQLSGFSLNGFGFTAGGFIVTLSAVTERDDDVANAWTARTNLNAANASQSGYATNEYFVNFVTMDS